MALSIPATKRLWLQKDTNQRPTIGRWNLNPIDDQTIWFAEWCEKFVKITGGLAPRVPATYLHWLLEPCNQRPTKPWSLTLNNQWPNYLVAKGSEKTAKISERISAKSSSDQSQFGHWNHATRDQTLVVGTLNQLASKQIGHRIMEKVAKISRRIGTEFSSDSTEFGR